MTQAKYDIAIVGGGINGVGVAQAAAAAGYSVLLLEKQSLAAGTSSKSSKLIHGGLRYLESYEFNLVRESLKERALLLKLAPELVQIQEFCLPVYRYTRRKPIVLQAGLNLYYLLSGFNAQARFGSVPKRQWDQLDGLRTDDLLKVFKYRDARTDDTLLTQAVMRSAQSLGAELACPAEFSGAELWTGGCQVDYRMGDRRETCTARVLINAAGPWVNHVLPLISPAPRPLPVELVRGSHVELPADTASLSGKYFYYLESRRDGRAVFVMPKSDSVLIGTTETQFRKHPDQVRPLPNEETYLLNIFCHYFPAAGHLSHEDLTASWAGLRVLPAGEGHAFHRSREEILEPDRKIKPRLLTIYGGKLTTYRKIAEKVMRRIQPSLPDRQPVAKTSELPLSPG